MQETPQDKPNFFNTLKNLIASIGKKGQSAKQSSNGGFPHVARARSSDEMPASRGKKAEQNEDELLATSARLKSLSKIQQNSETDASQMSSSASLSQKFGVDIPTRDQKEQGPLTLAQSIRRQVQEQVQPQSPPSQQLQPQIEPPAIPEPQEQPGTQSARPMIGQWSNPSVQTDPNNWGTPGSRRTGSQEVWGGASSDGLKETQPPSSPPGQAQGWGTPVNEQAPASQGWGTPVNEQAPAPQGWGTPVNEQAPAPQGWGTPVSGQAPAPQGWETSASGQMSGQGGWGGATSEPQSGSEQAQPANPPLVGTDNSPASTNAQASWLEEGEQIQTGMWKAFPLEESGLAPTQKPAPPRSPVQSTPVQSSSDNTHYEMSIQEKLSLQKQQEPVIPQEPVINPTPAPTPQSSPSTEYSMMDRLSNILGDNTNEPMPSTFNSAPVLQSPEPEPFNASPKVEHQPVTSAPFDASSYELSIQERMQLAAQSQPANNVVGKGKTQEQNLQSKSPPAARQSGAVPLPVQPTPPAAPAPAGMAPPPPPPPAPAPSAPTIRPVVRSTTGSQPKPQIPNVPTAQASPSSPANSVQPVAPIDPPVVSRVQASGAQPPVVPQAEPSSNTGVASVPPSPPRMPFPGGKPPVPGVPPRAGNPNPPTAKPPQPSEPEGGVMKKLDEKDIDKIFRKLGVKESELTGLPANASAKPAPAAPPPPPPPPIQAPPPPTKPPLPIEAAGRMAPPVVANVGAAEATPPPPPPQAKPSVSQAKPPVAGSPPRGPVPPPPVPAQQKPAASSAQSASGLFKNIDDDAVDKIFDNLGIKDPKNTSPKINVREVVQSIRSAAVETGVVPTPPPKVDGIGRLDTKIDNQADSGTGKISSIGKFLLDQQDQQQISKLSQANLNESKVRVLTLEAADKIYELLNHVAGLPGVVGSSIVGHDGIPIANNLPQEYDPESIGALSLGVYFSTTNSIRKMGHNHVHQLVAKSQQGYLIIADFGGGILITVSSGQQTEQLIPLMRSITQLVAQ